MGVIVPPGETAVIIRWSLAGDLEQMVCTLGFGQFLDPNPSQWALAVYGWLVHASGPCLPSRMSVHYALEGVSCNLQGEGGFVTGEHISKTQGTEPGDVAPSNCALLVKKNTALGGRRGRGRMFVPAFNLGAENITPTGGVESLSVIQGWWSAFYTNVATDALTPELVLHHSDGAPGTALTGLTVDGVLATQRNRMR